MTGFTADTILKNRERKLLNERVQQVNFKIKALKEKQDQLKKKIKSECFNKVMEYTHGLQLACHNETKARQVKKFARLKEHQGRADLDSNWRVRKDPTQITEAAKWVKNLSDRALSESELSVLAKGSNFVVVDKEVPIMEFIIVTESAIVGAGLNEAEVEILRNKVHNTICNNKAPRRNLIIEETKALNNLTKDDTIVIVPADKGKINVWSC